MLTASVAVLAPAGGVLTAFAGWRLAFLPYGIGLLLVIPTMLLLLRPQAPSTTPRALLGSEILGSLRRVRDREVRTPLVLCLLLLVVAGVLVAGLAEGLLVPTLQGALAGATGPADRGGVMSLWAATVRTAQTAGPLAAGFVMVFVGSGTALWASGLLVAGAMLLVLRGGMGTPAAGPGG